MKIDINPEQIRNAAIQQVADEAMHGFDVVDMLQSEVRGRVDEFLQGKATELMEQTLRDQLESLMTREIQPMNSWGERAGKPITLREELQKRAQEFWHVTVDSKGNPQQYGGKPRHQHMYEQIAKDQFAKAIEENINTVIAGFKDALRKDAATMLGEHIERFIKAPKR